MAVVHEVKTSEDILACWPVIQELRPDLVQSNLVARVQLQMKEGFRLVCIKEGSEVVAICGFRTHNKLFSGKEIYVDDLCTLSTAQRKGYAGKLLDWVIDFARREKFNSLTLDSEYPRINAHRLYLNEGFKLDCHHFNISL